MEIISYDKATSEVITKLTLTELSVFKNALNEITNGPNAVVKSEFDTRVGMPFERVKELLEIASDMVHRLDGSYHVIK